MERVNPLQSQGYPRTLTACQALDPKTVRYGSPNGSVSEWMSVVDADKTASPSAFDFELPHWLFPEKPCPVIPSANQETPLPRPTKLFLLKRAFEIEDWLASRGYTKNSQPGYLGIMLNPGAKTISRKGYGVLVPLGGKHWKLFCAIWHAGKDGVLTSEMESVYGSTSEARRTAVKAIRQAVSVLGLTITPGPRWILVEKNNRS